MPENNSTPKPLKNTSSTSDNASYDWSTSNVILKVEGKNRTIGIYSRDPRKGKPCQEKWDGKACQKRNSPHYCQPSRDKFAWFISQLKMPQTGSSQPVEYEPMDWHWEHILNPLIGVVVWNEDHQRWVRRYDYVWITVGDGHGLEHLGAALILFFMLTSKNGVDTLLSAKNKNATKHLCEEPLKDFILGSGNYQNSLLWNVHHKKSENKFYVRRSKGTFYESSVRVKHITTYRKARFTPVSISVLHGLEGYEEPSKVVDELEIQGSLHPEPLRMIITRLPNDNKDWIRQETDRMKAAVVDPSLEPSSLPVIFCLEETDDYLSQDTWKLRNPAVAEGKLELAEVRRLADNAHNSVEDKEKLIGGVLNDLMLPPKAWLARRGWAEQSERCLLMDKSEVWQCLVGGGMKVYGGAYLTDPYNLASMSLVGRYNGYLLVWSKSFTSSSGVEDLLQDTNGHSQTWIDNGSLEVIDTIDLPEPGISKALIEQLNEISELVGIGHRKDDMPVPARIWTPLGIKTKGFHFGGLTRGIRTLTDYANSQKLLHGNCSLLNWASTNTRVHHTAKGKSRFEMLDPRYFAARSQPIVATAIACQLMLTGIETREWTGIR